jgi:hypothetical protein
VQATKKRVPLSPETQLDELLVESKFHLTNSIGEIVRIEFFNCTLKKQIIGLLVNAFTKKTDKYVHLVIVDGNIGAQKIKVPIEEFSDKKKVRITRIRSLIEPYQPASFIPVDRDGKFTLSPEKIYRIKKIHIEDFKKLE